MRRPFSASLGSLLSDPPLRDRLVWRGLLTPRPDENTDTELKASTFGVLLTGGAVVAVLATIFDPRLVSNDGVMVAVAAVSAILGAVCLIGYRRLPDVFFLVAAAIGIGLIVVAAGASAEGSEPVYAPVFAIAVLMVMMMFPLRAAVALTAFATVAYGALLFARDNRNDFELLISTTVMIIAFGGVIGVLRRRGAAIRGELSTEAMTDQLTGIPNRRSFDIRFALEKERTRREQSRLGLIVCDLDRFKRINDTHGHEVGDEILRFFAASLADSIRGIDLPARVGGEEFAIILPGATTEDAAAVTERIRASLSADLERAPVPFTASFGVASAPAEGTSLSALYQRADRAMYSAKRAGRDCVALALDNDETQIIGGPSPVARLRQLF